MHSRTLLCCAHVITLALLIGCAQMPHTTEVSIASKKTHEDCFKMREGQTVDFEFRASQPMNFNLHYHQGSEVFFPLDIKKISIYSNSYIATRNDDFCLMWENVSAETAVLTRNFRVK